MELKDAATVATAIRGAVLDPTCLGLWNLDRLIERTAVDVGGNR